MIISITETNTYAGEVSLEDIEEYGWEGWSREQIEEELNTVAHHPIFDDYRDWANSLGHWEIEVLP